MIHSPSRSLSQAFDGVGFENQPHLVSELSGFSTKGIEGKLALEYARAPQTAPKIIKQEIGTKNLFIFSFLHSYDRLPSLSINFRSDIFVQGPKIPLINPLKTLKSCWPGRGMKREKTVHTKD